MKKSFVLLMTLFVGVQSYSQQETQANNILQEVSDNLSHMEKVSYHYFRDINYISEDYHHQMDGDVFVDFTQANPTFQLATDQYKIVYNGNESFLLEKEEKTMDVTYKPKYKSFESLSFFLNAIITLRNALPTIIADDSIGKEWKDTLIANKSYFQVLCTLHNKTLSGLGDMTPTTIKRDFFYTFIIDKATFLPIVVLQKNNTALQDYMLTSFTDINLSAKEPSEFSWYFSTYANEYTLVSKKKLELVKTNTIAPDWHLPYYDNNDTLGLSQLKGKIVLLDFYMKNCGPCIESVPKMNKLAEKYKDQLTVIGIDRYDSKEEINSFYKRLHPSYKTLHDLKGKVTTAYGVNAFPIVVLVDTNGVIRYAGSSDMELIEKTLIAIL